MLEEDQPQRVVSCRGKIKDLQRIRRSAQAIALLDGTADSQLEPVVAIDTECVGARGWNRDRRRGFNDILILIATNHKTRNGAVIAVVGRAAGVEVVNHQTVLCIDGSLL